MITIDQLLDLEDKTRALIEELEATVKRSGDDTAAISPDAAIGRLSRIDAMQQQEMAKAGVRRHRQRIAALYEVLQQMDDGAYGVCVKCHEEIEYSRLEIAPEVKLCAKCSAKAI
jgi:DnaK suppressor protein